MRRVMVVGILFVVVALAGCSSNPAFVTAADEYQKWSKGLIVDYIIEKKPIPESLDLEQIERTLNAFEKAVEAEGK